MKFEISISCQIRNENEHCKSTEVSKEVELMYLADENGT